MPRFHAHSRLLRIQSSLKRIEHAIRRQYLLRSQRPFTGVLLESPQNLVRASAPRILVLRQDRIGDVLCSTPILEALRNAFPRAQLDILLSTNNIALSNVVRHWCNRIWCYQKTLPSFVQTSFAIRHSRYDVMLDLMDNPSTTSTLFLRIAKAPIRIGIFKQNAWVYTHCVPLLDRSQYHYVERIAQLLMPFGIDPQTVPLDLHFPIGSDLIAAAADDLVLERYPTRTGFIMLHVSTRHTPLQWSWSHYATVIAELRQRFPDIAIGLGAAPDDRATASALAEQHGAFVLPTRPFHHYAAFLHFARLLISPDTSVVHVAAALKIPAVVLYHRGDDALLPWYPYRSPYRALVARCTGTVNVIPPAAVIDAATELLLNQTPPQAERIFAATSE